MDQFVLVPYAQWQQQKQDLSITTKFTQPPPQSATTALPTDQQNEPTVPTLVPKNLKRKLKTSTIQKSKKILEKLDAESRLKLSSNGTIVVDGTDSKVALETFLKSIQSTKQPEEQQKDLNLTLLDILEVDPSLVNNSHVKKQSRGNWIPFQI